MRSKLVAFVLVLAVASMAFAQTQKWQYGTLFVTDSGVTWYAPGEDYTTASMEGFIEAMQKRWPLPDSVLNTTRGALATVLNVLGYRGWELVSEGGTMYVFKRPR